MPREMQLLVECTSRTWVRLVLPVAIVLSGQTAAVLGHRTASQASQEDRVPTAIAQFAQTIDERIKRDSEIMGQMAHHLDGLENSTAKLAEDTLGKVYDMHSMDAFLSDHAAAVQEKAHLDQEVTRLTSVVQSLSKELEIVQNQTQQEEAAYQQQHRLRQETVQAKDAEAAATKSGFEHRRQMTESGVALERANEKLHAQNVEAQETFRNLSQELMFARRNLSKQELETTHLRAAVLDQQAYAEACAHELQQYESRLGAYRQVIDHVDGRGQRMRRLAEETNQVHQAILQKNFVLKARLKKALTNIATIQTQTSTTRAQQDQLENNTQAELASLGKALGELRAAEEAAKAELRALNISGEAEARRIEVAKANVEKFQQQLLSGEIAEMRSNNTQLKAELQQAEDTMQMSQANLVKYQADITQANQTLTSVRNASEEELQLHRHHAREALAKVIEAQQRGEAAAAKVHEALMQVETAAMADCNATWDAKNQPVLQEITRCVDTEQELRTVRAQVEVLTNTITASETQQSVQP